MMTTKPGKNLKKKKTEERRAGQNSRNSYRQIVMDDMEYS